MLRIEMGQIAFQSLLTKSVQSHTLNRKQSCIAACREMFARYESRNSEQQGTEMKKSLLIATQFKIFYDFKKSCFMDLVRKQHARSY